MFRDTTARNRAHQEFGTRHYLWLFAAKLLPWVLLFWAACVLFGSGHVGGFVSRAISWAGSGTAQSVSTLVVLAVILFAVKRRWRKGDYRP